MVLYFYILHSGITRIGNEFKSIPSVEISECEVIERLKTYAPVKTFPNGYYGSYIKKDDIGIPIGSGRNVVVLTEPDMERGLQILIDRYKIELDNINARARNIENKIAVIAKELTGQGD